MLHFYFNKDFAWVEVLIMLQYCEIKELYELTLFLQQ